MCCPWPSVVHLTQCSTTNIDDNNLCVFCAQVLIIVVVLSMALTPGLAELGKVAGDALDQMFPEFPDSQGDGSARAASEVKQESEMLKKRVSAF